MPSLVSGFAVATALIAFWTYRAIDFEKLPLPCLLPIADVPPTKYSEAAAFEGPFAKNTRLQKSIRLFEGQIAGSESVSFSKHGDQIYLIGADGFLKVAHGDPADPPSLTLESGTRAYLGPGRPLGFHVDAEDNLLTCNCILGLTRLADGSQTQQILANAVTTNETAHSPILYADDLDEAPNNGDVYFSDASAIPSALGRSGRYDAMRSSILTILQGSASGRLLRWSPATGETAVVASDLWFPNGVAVSADGDYVIVAETVTGRILKYHVNGPGAGSVETLIHKLPGYPDGVSRAPDGNFWAAIITEHVPALDWAARSRFARWAIAWLTELVALPTKHVGMAVKFSGEDGRVLEFLMDPDASRVGAITSVVEHGGWIYLGSLVNNFVGALKLDA